MGPLFLRHGVGPSAQSVRPFGLVQRYPSAGPPETDQLGMSQECPSVPSGEHARTALEVLGPPHCLHHPQQRAKGPVCHTELFAKGSQKRRGTHQPIGKTLSQPAAELWSLVGGCWQCVMVQEQCEGMEIPFGAGGHASGCLQQGKNCRARSWVTS